MENTSFKVFYSERNVEFDISSKNIMDYHAPTWVGINSTQFQSIMNYGDAQSCCSITWVTSYLDISFKHDHHEFTTWVDNLLSMGMCLVLYTDNVEIITDTFDLHAEPLFLDFQIAEHFHPNVSSELCKKNNVLGEWNQKQGEKEKTCNPD